MAISGADGSIILTTKVDQTGLKKGMSSIKSGTNSLSKGFSKLGIVIAAAFSVKVLVDFGKEAINLASNLEEVQNVVDVSFGNMAYRMEQFADTAIETFGISELTAKQTGSSFMAMAKGMQFADDVAADMALTLTGLSADMASFYNISQEEAKTALSAVYTGETETLKRYGILITEVNLQEFARQQGITKSINAMTQQEKVMLRYQYVLQATQLAQGDFVRTQDSWANQTRVLQERWKEMSATFGEAFITIGTLVLPIINDLIKGLSKVAEITKVIAQNIYTAFTGKEIKEQTNEQNKGIAQSVENQNALTEAVEETNEALKGGLAGFDEINTLTQDTAENQELLGGVGGIGGVGNISGNVNIETENAEKKMSTFSQKVLTFIEPITKSFEDFFKPLKKSFDELDMEGMKDEFSEWRKNLAKKEVEATAKGVDSLRVAFETISQPLKDLWKDALQPIVEDFGGWITDIVDQTGESFDYFSEKLVEYKDEIEMVIDGISEIIQTIWAVISPIIGSVIDGIGSKLKTTIDFIFSIIQVLGNFFDFFKNIFSGIKAFIKGDTEEATQYLKKALANIVNIFVGMGNGIISIINNLWSLIFDAFKGTVNAIGGLISKIGDWLGFDWELKWNAKVPLIPKIPKYVPKLATGTVVPPNREFMAVLGDNKREPEIVSPLSTMKQAVAEVLAQANIGGGFNGRIEVPVIINGREVARAVREAEGNMGKQTVFGGFANAY